MEFKPDARHLAGGMAAAALLSAYLLFSGLSSPAATYYEPGHAAHSGGRYDEITCKNCHEPWRAVENASCLGCHDHDKLRAALDRPVNPAGPRPTATQQLHILLKVKACRECHLEHRETELEIYLKLPAPERRRSKFFGLIHDPIPAANAGRDQCGTCHTPEEQAALEREMEAGSGRVGETPAAAPAAIQGAAPAANPAVADGLTSGSAPAAAP